MNFKMSYSIKSWQRELVLIAGCTATVQTARPSPVDHPLQIQHTGGQCLCIYSCCPTPHVPQLTASETERRVCCELQVCATLLVGGLADLTTLHTPFGWKWTASANLWGARLLPALVECAGVGRFSSGTETVRADPVSSGVSRSERSPWACNVAKTGCSSRLWFSCSAALCSAASTSSLRSLKSCGQGSGGVGGGVLNSRTVGFTVTKAELLQAVDPGIVVKLGAPVMFSLLSRPRVSNCMRFWTPPSRPDKPDPSRQPAPFRMAVAVLPSMLRSRVGAGRMTEGRDAETAGGEAWSGEAEPTDLLSDFPARREIVNRVGSLPSFLRSSGRSRRRALMNQLQIWKRDLLL